MGIKRSAMRKTKFSKEMIIKAGLQQLQRRGWEGMTPKRVAKRLGASTMPIFSHFATMDELKEAVLDRAWEMLLEYASRNYTNDVWVDQSVGYIIFARDHGQLFNCMHYGPADKISERRYRFWLALSQQLGDISYFEGMNTEHIGWARHIRSLLTHGIAISMSTGLSTVWKNDELVKRVMALCSDVLSKGFAQQSDRLDEISAMIPNHILQRINQVSD
jgi:AcrR family transcriptional regulator